MEQERILQAAQIEQIARQLEANLQLIEHEIAELNDFKNNLNFLTNSNEKEMLSSLGKRVFIKTKIEDKDKLFVEVGAGVIVKKTPAESLKIVEHQITQLKKAREQIGFQLESYREELRDFIREMED